MLNTSVYKVQRLLQAIVLAGGVAGGVLLALPEAAPAQTPVQGQRAILALEAAEQDAYRNLLERLRGVSVDGETTVEDLVVADSETRAQLESFVRGARVIEENIHPSGRATVTVQLDVERVEMLLGHELPDQLSTLEAEGQGAAPAPTAANTETAAELGGSDSARAPLVPAEVEGRPQPDRTEEQANRDSLVEVTGKGVPPDGEDLSDAQKRLLAKRAARNDAFRRLLEYVYGVRVDASTTVEDLVVESDEIESEVEAFVRGAKTVSSSYSDGVATVTLVLDLSDLNSIIRESW